MIKNTKENRKNAYLLKFTYSNVIKILNSVKIGSYLYKDIDLNEYYLSSIEIINGILNKKDFSELKKKAPNIYDNIIGQINDIDYSWDVYQREIYNFLSEIQDNNRKMKVTENDAPKNIETLKEELATKIGYYINIDTKEDCVKKYWISLKNRNIILNDKYQIKRLQFNRPSDILFEYIFKNSKKEIVINKIKEIVDNKSKIDFNKFVNNIGFKGELRKCFFDVSKTTLRFTNPLTQKDLEERNINIPELEKQIKELSR